MSEKGVVQEFLRRLEELGWKKSAYCPGVVRENVIINEIFEESFKRLNRKVLASENLEDKMDVVLSKVKEMLIRAEPHELLEYLRSGLFIEESRKRVKVILIDYENINNNEFTACEEVRFLSEGSDIRRLDVVLYVNGIPLVVVEVEDPLRLGERALEEGINQLYRYEKEIPWLFKYVQIGITYADVENSVYMPMTRDLRGKERWSGKWRDLHGNYNILDLLERRRLLDILRWFTFYKGREKRDKVIPRYNQYWATVKAVGRIVNYLEGRDTRNRGLIWHWQGSGKTYIMFYIAYQFYRRFFEKDPVVFFIIDRKELQRQLYDEFIKDIHAPYFQEHIRIVERIDDLKSILKDIKEKEMSKLAISRGVYVVLIQKFRPEELEELLPIDKREVLVLLDEAHRSQYGVLGAVLNRVLPNAVKFAFTGTPVMGYERNTFLYFAYPSQEEFYLDKYFISDSIKDGYTLPLKYQVVQEIKGVKVNVSQDEIKDLLDTWVKSAYEVGSLDDLVDEEDERVLITVTKREIRQKLNKIRVFLENPKRLSLIAEYIADNVRDDTENFKFKAMVVVSSRLACVRMKRALDEALTKRYGDEARKWSEVVMTYLSNEGEGEIRDYLDELLSKWRGAGDKVVRDWDEVNRMIQDSFKEREEPRILIVTDMLITGFDCPKLKVMYLDKSLYEHRLLQAVARVNRPYKTQNLTKEFGLIVDFVGLLDYVKETIVKYETLDVEAYKKIFEESIHTLKDATGELGQLIDEIRQKLTTGINVGNHKVELNIDEIIKLIDEGKDSQAYAKLINAASLLAMGYRNYDPNVIDLLAKMKRACNLYRALGAFKDKLRFHSYIVIITKLYNGIFYYINMKGIKLSEGFWRELLKMVHDKTSIPEIGLIEEFLIEPVNLAEISKKLETTEPGDPQMKYMAAEAILTIKGILDLEPANPVYKHIYERLKKLEAEWARRIDSHLIREIKELITDLSDYSNKRASMKLNERLIYDVKESLHRRFNVVVTRLESLELTLNKVIKKYESLKISRPVFFDEDKRSVKLALLRDLFKIGLREPREAERIADELTDYIEREVMHELQKRY
jgi:type I restriction enzyme R subunit